MLNKSNNNNILLLHPPGWSLNYGSPHLGLPLLQGYLKKQGIPCKIKDVNIETANYHNIFISEEQIDGFATKEFNGQKADSFYFEIADKMQKIGNRFLGDWKIKSGFNFVNCNLSSSEDIRKFSKEYSPFTKYYKEKLLPYINETKPLLIGLSVTVPSQLLSAFEIIRLIRKEKINCKIVIGGNTITRLSKEIQKDWVFSLVDYAILNQGEESIEMLWKHLAYSEFEISNIPNLIWKKKGLFYQNKYKALKQTDFSMPDFSGYPVGKYWGINYLPLIGARGCYYGKCSFCPIPFAWGNNGFVGYDDPENIINSIIELTRKNNIFNFSFVEESMNAKKLLLLSEKIIENKLNVNFEGYVRLDKSWAIEKNIEVFSKAGLKKVFIGLELLSSNGRLEMNKSDKVDDILFFLELFKKYSIKVHLFTMFGYPKSSVDDSLNTIEFLLNNRDLIETIDVSHFVYSKHTNVNGVQKIVDKNEDWALKYKYYPKDKNDFSYQQAKILANHLESIIIKEVPEWLHPIYRMYSSWKN